MVRVLHRQGPVERDYKRGATITFDKGGPSTLNSKITDAVTKHQPEFKIKTGIEDAGSSAALNLQASSRS